MNNIPRRLTLGLITIATPAVLALTPISANAMTSTAALQTAIQEEAHASQVAPLTSSSCTVLATACSTGSVSASSSHTINFSVHTTPTLCTAQYDVIDTPSHHRVHQRPDHG